MRSKLALAAMAWLISCALNVAQAQLVTFETKPGGGIPVDDAALSAPYNFSGGSVRFFFDTNGNNRFDAATDALPVFEHIGSEANNGFASTFNGIPDTARPGYTAELGTYFLRQPDAFGNVPGPFIADYTTSLPIRGLSGEIWDIDGTTTTFEQWRVDVLDGTGNVLATELSPKGIDAGPTSLDSLPWVYQFTNLPDGVSAVRMTYVGTKTGVGLAFNNFSPDVAVPEPSSVLMAAPLLVMLARRRRSR
ncbi:MAG: motif protein [Massilia sp.]|nr:motif protein [Massilia sp.]